jgi:hypothetical protein
MFLTCIQEVVRSNLTAMLAVPSEVVCSFPESLQANASIVLKTGSQQFSFSSFLMIIHSSSYH